MGGLWLSTFGGDSEWQGESCCPNPHGDTEIRLKRAVVPSMFSTNERVVHQDCLGYLMERFALPTSSDS